jgi:hypothetical protein
VGFIGLEFVRSVGVNLSTKKEKTTLKMILKDLIALIYQGMSDILGQDMDKEVELNFVAENKSGMVLSIFHTCVRMLTLSAEDRQYYSSFKEFDTSFCDVFDSEDKKVQWLRDNLNKSVVINPFIGSASWQNHNLLLLLNGIFDESSLFPLTEYLLQAQINLATPFEKFYKIEDDYFDFITKSTGFKYSTDISGGEFNKFFDNYLDKDFYTLINKNFDFRKFFSISKNLTSPRNENVRFDLDDDIRSFNIDNYYLSGLMSNFYLYISDSSLKCSQYYLQNRFDRFKDVFKVNFEFFYTLKNSNDFVTLNTAEYKDILDNLVKD